LRLEAPHLTRRRRAALQGGRNPAEQHPIPIHPLGTPWPPRPIQGKDADRYISESRKSRRNSVHYPVNAGSLFPPQRCHRGSRASPRSNYALGALARLVENLAHRRRHLHFFISARSFFKDVRQSM
jgi:hypothetical protein